MPKELEDWFQHSLPMVCKRLLITTNCSDFFFFQTKWIAIAKSQLQFHIGHKGVIWIKSLWFTTVSAEFRLLTSSIPCCHTPSYPLGPKLFRESKNRREQDTMEQLVPWSKDGRADFWCTKRIRALILNQCWGLLWFLLESTLRAERDKNTDNTWAQLEAKASSYRNGLVFCVWKQLWRGSAMTQWLALFWKGKRCGSLLVCTYPCITCFFYVSGRSF